MLKIQTLQALLAAVQALRQDVFLRNKNVG
jgi:hypothetical protein